MTHHQKIARFVAIALVALSIAGQAIADNPTAKTNGYKLATGILYRDVKDATSYMRERCRLDVYSPETVEDFATVVWFHGGGLTSGNRSVPAQLKQQGIGVVGSSDHYAVSAEISWK